MRDMRFFGVAFDLWEETGPAGRSGGPREVGFSISSRFCGGILFAFFVCLFADGSAPGGRNGSGLLAFIHLHSPDGHQQPIEGV